MDRNSISKVDNAKQEFDLDQIRYGVQSSDSKTALGMQLKNGVIS